MNPLLGLDIASIVLKYLDRQDARCLALTSKTTRQCVLMYQYGKREFVYDASKKSLELLVKNMECFHIVHYCRVPAGFLIPTKYAKYVKFTECNEDEVKSHLKHFRRDVVIY